MLTSVAFAALSTFLFYKRDLGINLLLFETTALAVLFATRQVHLKNRTALLMFAALLISAVFTVVNYSAFGYIIHFIICTFFIGLILYPYTRSLTTSLALSLNNILTSQKRFLYQITHWGYNGKGIFKTIFRAGIFIIPAFIVILFFLIYQKSNPVFEKIFAVPMEKLTDFLRMIFEDFNFLMLFTFLFGLFISNIIFLRKGNEYFIEKDKNASENLERCRKKNSLAGHNLSLKNEYRAAVFLFGSLNLLLLILNVVDVYSVWFHFEWNGQYLKQYVHEGTYLLILSIIISIVLVLYYFRGNLNHYPKQKLLRVLTFAWLAQNALLVISVAIRNYWYIQFFALAYKRIGVYIFLALTLFGLYSVWKKVKDKKTMFYLYKANTVAWLTILTASSLINWDNLITSYNFSKSGNAFLHLEFLTTLPDKSLPYLDKSYDELVEIDNRQKALFHFDEVFMTPEIYYNIVRKRKKRFKEKWERKDMLEWNFAEWRSYRQVAKSSLF